MTKNSNIEKIINLVQDFKSLDDSQIKSIFSQCSKNFYKIEFVFLQKVDFVLNYLDTSIFSIDLLLNLILPKNLLYKFNLVYLFFE